MALAPNASYCLIAPGADMSTDMSGAGVKPEMGKSPGWDCSQHSRTPTQRYTVITRFIDPISLDLVETNKKLHHRKPQTAFPASIVPQRSSAFRLSPACYCFTRCLLTSPASRRAHAAYSPITTSLQSACGNWPGLGLAAPVCHGPAKPCHREQPSSVSAAT